MLEEFPKRFSKEKEKEIYALWEKEGFFDPNKLPKKEKRKKSFTIMLPPPNITGSLHMGHALNATCQDILIRQKRMNNYLTLWVPGKDHAGIATQNVVEKKLKKEGKNRHDLGRKKFVDEVWQWMEQYGQIISNQFKTLGASCDWSRERFTMDESYQRTVQNAFLTYYKKGLIYQGERIINWCPRCQTALSDIELEHKLEQSKLWEIKYHLKQDDLQSSHSEQSEESRADARSGIRERSFTNAQDDKTYIVVKTTRPETMLADMAIAVNPKDKRWQNLIGQNAIIPLINREIPIIADEAVDMEFGTGAVKVTPAHDPVDFAIWERNKERLGQKIIKGINKNAKTIVKGPYFGLKVKEAREKIVMDLEKNDDLAGTQDYAHEIPVCYRCGSVIEPLISKQWFLKMKPLAKKAIEAVENGEIKFTPKRFEKIYLDWMENVKDWCISRQIWWGHQIPVYYRKQEIPKLQNPNDKQFQNANKEKSKIKIGGNVEIYVGAKKPDGIGWEQDKDVLDTWFSSALWPFAALGWTGSGKIKSKNKDLEIFYPTSTLSTARDILYLWVARMIFSGYFFTDKKPFSRVYIHPTVLTKEGRRMSKSLGTGIDPLDLWEKYGADATRFGLALKSGYRQQIKFNEQDYAAGRNFTTKVWNAGRFIYLNLGKKTNLLDKNEIKKLKLDKGQRETLGKFYAVAKNVKNNINSYHFDLALKEIYEFFWHNFCDYCIEENKEKMKNGDKDTLQFLSFILINSLILLHPFMPFVTEGLLQKLKQKIETDFDYLIVAPWPK